MQDPYLILGVDRDKDDESIHQAYLEAVRHCPAEQDPERFKAIRDAYELISTRKARLAYALFNTDLPTTADLFERLATSGPARRPGIEDLRALLATPRATRRT